jgi:hypothetical protein
MKGAMPWSAGRGWGGGRNAGRAMSRRWSVGTVRGRRPTEAVMRPRGAREKRAHGADPCHVSARVSARQTARIGATAHRDVTCQRRTPSAAAVWLMAQGVPQATSPCALRSEPSRPSHHRRMGRGGAFGLVPQCVCLCLSARRGPGAVARGRRATLVVGRVGPPRAGGGALDATLGPGGYPASDAAPGRRCGVANAEAHHVSGWLRPRGV